MVKHNNIVPNVHLRKHWETRVKTWFNQPARKLRRRQARVAKAARVFPRPVAGDVRPVVRGQTVKYNTKLRIGRGFSLQELRAAGISRIYARTVGIAVDHRRRNRSQEGIDANVQRLKEYTSKLVIFGKDAKPEDVKAAVQVKGTIMPIKQAVPVVEFRAPTAEEKAGAAVVALRKFRADARLVGVRQKLKEKKQAAAEESAKSK